MLRRLRSGSRKVSREHLTLGLASTLFALALCEIGLRVADISFPRFDEPDARYGSSLIPGATGWFTQEGRAFVAINAAGFRDRDHSLARDPGTLRIALLGDSFTEGGPTSDEPSEATLL